MSSPSALLSGIIGVTEPIDLRILTFVTQLRFVVARCMPLAAGDSPPSGSGAAVVSADEARSPTLGTRDSTGDARRPPLGEVCSSLYCSSLGRVLAWVRAKICERSNELRVCCCCL